MSPMIFTGDTICYASTGNLVEGKEEILYDFMYWVTLFPLLLVTTPWRTIQFQRHSTLITSSPTSPCSLQDSSSPRTNEFSIKKNGSRNNSLKLCMWLWGSYHETTLVRRLLLLFRRNSCTIHSSEYVVDEISLFLGGMPWITRVLAYLWSIWAIQVCVR